MLENPRRPAVAGMFYPAQEKVLRALIGEMMAQAPEVAPEPVAMVAPHAGYIYSGLTAAYAYKTLEKTTTPRRVILVGPSHRVALQGVSVGNFTSFLTPLGAIPVDQAILEDLCREPDVTANPTAHIQEHSLEVHLPFLQEALGNFTLVPMVYGHIRPSRLAELISICWHPRDLLVFSSDLSHYHPYLHARELDSQVHRAVLSLDSKAALGCEACGGIGISAILDISRKRGWRPMLADYRNSGDTAGDKAKVVGYASYLFHSADGES
ncbi:MAG: AmmeMemoRadiSam system protein B [Magnetococcales bacterium]|nr:AmmeMemoRadiSam system protein B [Magnetococcales bacterium]